MVFKAIICQGKLKLQSPHIPLGITFEEGLQILQTALTEIEKVEEDNEDFYMVSSNEFSCGFYLISGLVSSTWYDDSIGRDTEDGINLKVTLYLQRYGDISQWKDGINNGLGTLRNKHGDAHRAGSRSIKPKPRHAELAVNLAGTMAIFLVQTYESNKT